MFETFKKTLYAGLGAAMLSKEAIGKVLDDWVAKGKISADDAKEFFSKATKVGEENWEKTRGDFAEKAEALGEKWPFATREQVCGISRRLKAIEEKLGIVAECGCDGEKKADDAVPAESAETKTDA